MNQHSGRVRPHDRTPFECRGRARQFWRKHFVTSQRRPSHSIGNCILHQINLENLFRKNARLLYGASIGRSLLSEEKTMAGRCSKSSGSEKRMNPSIPPVWLLLAPAGGNLLCRMCRLIWIIAFGNSRCTTSPSADTWSSLNVQQMTAIARVDSKLIHSIWRWFFFLNLEKRSK